LARIRHRGRRSGLRPSTVNAALTPPCGPGQFARPGCPLLPGSLAQAALLAGPGESRGPQASRSDGVAALDAAGAAWTISGGGIGLLVPDAQRRDCRASALGCPVPPVQDRPIAHFTHVGNLPTIMKGGCVLADSLVRGGGVAINECGNIEIKERRRTVAVPISPGGVVSDYVPFYFAPRSPMMFSIHKGNVPTYQEGQEPLIYLWSHSSVVAQMGLPWVGSDGNAAHSLSVMTNRWDELERMVDWSIMTERYWRDTPTDGDRMRRRMAELLVHRQFPISAIQGIVAKSETTAELARRHVSGNIPVSVAPDWYY
jgi:hypothetical protein